MDSNNTDRVATLTQAARKLAREGSWSQAIEMNSRILDLDPTRDDAYTRRGICYQQTGRLEDAETDFDEATELNPNNHTAWRRLEQVGKDLDNLGRDKELREEWRVWGLSLSSSASPYVPYGSPGYRDETPLYALGYRIVDDSGRRLSRQERWHTLIEEVLPTLGLHEVAWTIASHCRERKLQHKGRDKYAYAIAEWEHDLSRLKAVFYHETVAAFSWPSAEPQEV